MNEIQLFQKFSNENASSNLRALNFYIFTVTKCKLFHLFLQLNNQVDTFVDLLKGYNHVQPNSTHLKNVYCHLLDFFVSAEFQNAICFANNNTSCVFEVLILFY